MAYAITFVNDACGCVLVKNHSRFLSARLSLSFLCLFHSRLRACVSKKRRRAIFHLKAASRFIAKSKKMFYTCFTHDLDYEKSNLPVCWQRGITGAKITGLRFASNEFWHGLLQLGDAYQSLSYCRCN